MWAVGDDTDGAGLPSNCVQILVTYNQVEWILAVHDKYQFLHSCEMSKQQDGIVVGLLLKEVLTHWFL